MKRNQKTIALVAAQLLAAYMMTERQGGTDEARPLFNYIADDKPYDDSEHAAGVEKLLAKFADLADRLVVMSDPETIDAHNEADE